MTSQPQPAPGDAPPVGQYLRPLRDLAAWALVGAPAVLLFVAIIRLIPAGDGEQFASRTQDSFYSFVNLTTIIFPLAAVLLSLLVRPSHPKAKLITVIALTLPQLLGGAVIIEQVFSWPGMGTLAIAAVRGRDYPTIMAINLIGATAILVSNLLADVLYAWVDPRVKYA